MMTKCKAVNSEILEWARMSAGYSVSDIAQKYKKYEKWENGEDFPTYVQLEQLAKIFKRPLAIFFFPEIPQEISTKKSFRTIPAYELEELSPTLNFLFRKACAMQENLKELNNNINPAETNIIDSINIKNSFTKKDLSNIREILDITLSEQKKFKNRDEAFEAWRNAFADVGIYVFKEPFRDDNVGGFCLYDEAFPIIFVNNSTSKNRQTFTLFHELAHLLLRNNHIDFSDMSYIKELSKDDKHIEIICNKFAGDFLVPDEDFYAFIERVEITESRINSLSNTYSVSKEVIARKLLNADLIASATYKRLADKWTKEALEYQKGKDDGGGNYYYNQITYLGKSYLGLVMDKYNARLISFDKAVEYSRIKAKNFSKLESHYTQLAYGGI